MEISKRKATSSSPAFLPAKKRKFYYNDAKDDHSVVVNSRHWLYTKAFGFQCSGTKFVLVAGNKDDGLSPLKLNSKQLQTLL